MSTELVRGRDARASLPAPLTIAAGRQHTAETILRAWREGKSDHTIRSYQHDLEDFALYFSRALTISPLLHVNAALDRLFKQSSPSAHEIVLGFRHHLASAHMAAASINRHLAALRSVTKLSRMLGLTNWILEVPGVKSEKRRDTRGPSVDGVRRMLAATSRDTEAETRDRAIVTTFYCLGLRVSELCGLTLEETDLTGGTTWIRGKARREKELVPLPAPVVEALRAYLTHRGTVPGPLFQTRGQRGKSRTGALETRSVLRIVRELGQKVGLHVWCHSLRHSSITQAAELGQRAGLGLDKIRAHSRHRTIATLMCYVDETDRTQNQKTLADLVAGTLFEKVDSNVPPPEPEATVMPRTAARRTQTAPVEQMTPAEKRAAFEEQLAAVKAMYQPTKEVTRCE
jgi:integrase/recombinase XerC